MRRKTWTERARELGREHGENAAGWWTQENGGGRDTRGPAELRAMAEKVLRGMEDVDQEIMDSIPAPDLSGQWADGLTPKDLLEHCCANPDSERAQEAVSDLCDSYETAFHYAVEREITKHLRAMVER